MLPFSLFFQLYSPSLFYLIQKTGSFLREIQDIVQFFVDKAEILWYNIIVFGTDSKRTKAAADVLEVKFRFKASQGRAAFGL